MIKNLLKILLFFVLGIFGGIFADQILWPFFVERPLFYQYRLEKNPIYLTETKEITIQENVAMTDAIEKVERVVIGVKTKTKAGKNLEGSGLILTSDGLAVTLAELVPQGSTFSFFVDGELTAAQILKRDLKENLALIKIEKTNLSTVGFFNFEKLKLGERVFLIGVIPPPNGGWTVNEGIVKNFNADSVETNIFEKSAISGSPLFDIEGNVLGLNKINSAGEIISIPITKIKSFSGL